MTKYTHTQLKKKAMNKSGVKKEYDLLQDEFNLFEEMIKARLKSGKTQNEVAKVMKTTISVVGRLETGGGKKQHSPTIATLLRYAEALDCKLQIKFIKQSKYSNSLSRNWR